MLCPVCGSEKLKVSDTRKDLTDNTRINRIRNCTSCGIGWPTKEVPTGIYFELMKMNENKKI